MPSLPIWGLNVLVGQVQFLEAQEVAFGTRKQALQRNSDVYCIMTLSGLVSIVFVHLASEV